MEAQTVKVSSKRQITIPVSFKQVKEGDTILLLSSGEDIILKPLEEILEIIMPALASEEVLAKDWLSEEDEKAYEHLQKL